MKNLTPLLVGTLLAALAGGAQAAPRVLLESPDADVRMEKDLRCGRDAEVTVIARDPELLSGGSPRMQSLLDATRAVLGFECRNIAGIVVSGRLDGIGEDAYQAFAGPENGWRLDASRTVQVSALGQRSGASSSGGGYSEWTAPASQQQAAGGSNAFAVRELQRGMGVDEALAAARQSFSAGSDGDERLERLVFGQVVDQDQSAAIRDALERRYGPPASATQPDPGTTRLAWGRTVPGDGDRRELEAQIEVREGTTVLVIELASATEQPRFQADF